MPHVGRQPTYLISLLCLGFSLSLGGCEKAVRELVASAMVDPLPVPQLQAPAPAAVQACAPLDWSKYGPEAADDDAVLERCYDEITSVMQSTLDGLARENPKPLVSRLRSLVGR